MHECSANGMCKCPHHKMVPLCITLIGLAFFLQAIGVLGQPFVSVAWPVLLTLIGLQKLSSGMCSCCGDKK